MHMKPISPTAKVVSSLGRSSWSRTMMALIVTLLVAVLPIHAAKVKIELWHGFPDRPPYQAFVELIDEFNRTHPTIEVQLLGKSVRPESVVPAVVGGAAPNVVVSTYSYTPQYAGSDFLVDLTPFMQKDGLLQDYNKDWIPGSLPAMRWGGKIWGIPTDVNVFTPMYVTTVLDEAGLAYPHQNWTWDDLLQISKKVRRVDAKGAYITYPTLDESAISTSLPFFLQMGVRFFDSEGRKATLNTPDARQTLAYIQQMYDEGYMYASNGNEARPLFTINKAGFILSTTEALGTFYEQNPGVRVAPTLRAPGRDPVTAMNYYNVVIMQDNDPAKVAASWELVKYLTQPKALVKIAVVSKTIPARLSALRDREYLNALRSNKAMFVAATEVAPLATTEGWATIPIFGEWLARDLVPHLGRLRPNVSNRLNSEEFITAFEQATQIRLDSYWVR